MSNKSPIKYVCTLSNASQQKAELELNEKPDKRVQAIERLRKAVLGYPGLTSPVDDAFLLRFLRARKFDEDRALHLIVQHFRVRNVYPDVFENFRPSACKQVADSGVINFLPLRDDEGRYIVWIKMGAWSPDTCPMIDVVRMLVMALETLLEDEETQVNGVSYITDFKDFGMSKAVYATPSLNKKAVEINQNSTPQRIKAVHYVNEPLIISYIWPIIRQFLKQKIIDRVKFHGQDMSSLHQHISPDRLPPALGGTMTYWPEIRQKWLNDSFYASEEKFVEMEKYKLVEDKPGEKGGELKSDALQGMSGTFRKLNLD